MVWRIALLPKVTHILSFRLHFVSLRMTKNLVLKNKTLGLCPNTQQVFSCSEILLGQEFSYEQVHKFPLEMASPPPYILAVCFENCLRQRRFLRRSQQNGYAAASIFAIPKRFNRNFSQNHKEKYPTNQNFNLKGYAESIFLF